MKKKSKPTGNTKTKLLELLRHFQKGIILVDLASESIYKKKVEIKEAIICGSLFNLHESLETIVLLTKYKFNNKDVLKKSKDIIIISRSVYESIINILFILANGENAAKEALHHYLYRSNKKCEKNIKIGDKLITFISPNPTIKSHPQFNEAIEAFTKRKKKFGWSEKTMSEKLIEIQKKYGVENTWSLTTVYELFYGEASEVAHGSFYSSMYLLGLAGPEPKLRQGEDFDNYQREAIFEILMSLIHCMLILADKITEEYKTTDLQKQYDANLNAITSYLEETLKKYRRSLNN